MSVKISSVDKHSLCDKRGIKANDILVAVNDNEIMDVLDYRFYILDDKLKLTV